MKRFLPVRLMLCALLASPMAVPEAYAQAVLQSDTFDNNIVGWSADGDPGAQLDWDGAIGSPEPGSLRLFLPDGNTAGGVFKAVGQCQSVVAGRTYSVVAQVRHDLGDRGGSCVATPVFFDQADCQGSGSIGGGGDVVPDGRWVRRVSEVTAFGGSQSMRVEMVMQLDPGSGQAACHFDSMNLYFGRFSTFVPALRPWALLGLVLMVAALGCWWSRPR